MSDRKELLNEAFAEVDESFILMTEEPPKKKKAIITAPLVAAMIALVLVSSALTATLTYFSTRPNDPPIESSTPSDSTPGETPGESLPTVSGPADIWEGNASTAFAGGSGTEDDPYLIDRGLQLAHLSIRVGNGTSFEGQYFRLAADLDLSGYEWKPIGDYNNPFSGTFDGAGHTIKGLNIAHQSTYFGLFGVLNNATVKNLILADSKITVTSNVSDAGNIYAGVLAAYSRGDLSVENVRVKGSDVKVEKATFDKLYAGGIIGHVNANRDKSILIGRVSGEMKVIVRELGLSCYFGGIIGGASITNSSLTLSDFRSDVQVEEIYLYAGAVGRMAQSGGIMRVENGFSTVSHENTACDFHELTGRYVLISEYSQTGRAPQAELHRLYGHMTCLEYPVVPCGLVLLPREFTYELTESGVGASLPADHGLDESVWDLTDLSNPKLK